MCWFVCYLGLVSFTWGVLVGLGCACYIKVTFDGCYCTIMFWCCFDVLVVDSLLLIVLLSFLYFFWVGLLCGICLCLVFCSDVGVCCLFIVDWLVICVVIGYLWVTGCGGCVGCVVSLVGLVCCLAVYVG